MRKRFRHLAPLTVAEVRRHRRHRPVHSGRGALQHGANPRPCNASGRGEFRREPATGRCGDEPGFDKAHIKTYGFGQVAAKDFLGQSTWSSFVSTTGWRLGNKANWPTELNYNDPRLVKTMDWIRTLVAKGYAPKIGTFTNTVSDVDLLSSGKVAMETGGSWSASTFAKIPNIKVGIGPTVLGPDGKTRAVFSNSNGNTVWAGTKSPDLAWKWVSYMGTETCQTKASATGTFFPSIPASMDASAKALKAQGVDLTVFTDMLKNKELYPSPDFRNGAALRDAIEPLIEAYFAGQKDDSVFADMQAKTKSILNEK
jgi:multiple sugar transport system substrate-binding protein